MTSGTARARNLARATLATLLFSMPSSNLRAGPEGAFMSDALEVVFQFSLAPAGLTAAPDGNWLLSVDQAEKPRARVVKVLKSGKVESFPTERMSECWLDEVLPLDAVEGMQLDEDGIVWMLDNGRRNEITPKVVGWNFDKRRLHSVHHIGQPAVLPGSFVADLAVDPNEPFIYLADPAQGADAALIVLDRASGLTRRVLQGHFSMQPDGSVPLKSGRNGSTSRRLDGAQTLPHCGVGPLALDRKGEWLYYAPIRSNRLYRIRTELLRGPDVSAEKLVQGVEVFAEKPPAAAITVDNKGNIYAGDIENRAIGVIDGAKRTYRILASDPRLMWADGLCFGEDDLLYFFSRSQFASAQTIANGRNVSATTIGTAGHSLFRMKPLAPGRVGD